MAKYMIHACPQRMWYVDGYLIPSMLSQGVERDDITLWVDTDNLGCLESCMRAFESLPDDGGTWHLQDDVVISRRFRELTEKFDSGIVCGHTWYKNRDTINCVGEIINTNEMWMSFPCIRIPNDLARSCARFYRDTILVDDEFQHWVKARRYDDSVFSVFLQRKGTRERILNLVPNLVAHIDYLIGGTVANDQRADKGEEPYFDEPETMEGLERWLDAYKG